MLRLARIGRRAWGGGSERWTNGVACVIMSCVATTLLVDHTPLRESIALDPPLVKLRLNNKALITRGRRRGTADRSGSQHHWTSDYDCLASVAHGLPGPLRTASQHYSLTRKRRKSRTHHDAFPRVDCTVRRRVNKEDRGEISPQSTRSCFISTQHLLCTNLEGKRQESGYHTAIKALG